MSTKPFLFEKSFDRPKGSVFLAEMVQTAFDVEEQAAEVALATPALYGDEEMAIARQVAREEGYAAGLEAARTEQAAQEIALLTRLGPLLEKLLQAQQQIPAAVQAAGIDTAGHLVRHLFPHLADEHTAPQFQELCRAAFDQIGDESCRLTVQCAADDRVLLETLLSKMPAAHGFAGKIVYSVQSDFAAGDIRLDWGDGGVERLSARIRYKLDQILARHSGPQTQESDHD